MKRNPLGTLRNKADKLLQERVHREYKFCMLCSNQCTVGHHFFPKSVSSRLRYEWENIIPLCNGCHMRLHQSGDPSYELRIKEKKGEDWYFRLHVMKHQYVKTNMEYYRNMVERLTTKNI